MEILPLRCQLSVQALGETVYSLYDAVPQKYNWATDSSHICNFKFSSSHVRKNEIGRINCNNPICPRHYYFSMCNNDN